MQSDKTRKYEEDSDYFVVKRAVLTIASREDSDPAIRASAKKWLDRHSYKRPTRGWVARPVSKILGPVPNDLIAVMYGTFAKGVKIYKLQPFLVMICAVCTLIAAVILFPALAQSPMTILIDFMTFIGMPGWLSVIIVTAIGFTFVITAINGIKHKAIAAGGFWESAAAEEEMWFRSGSENWSWGQRILSCMGFGFVHIANFIYPVVSILVTMLVGGILMYVYLRAYKRTGSTYTATAESARFHATYNKFAIFYTLIAIPIALSASYFLS